MDLRFGVSVDIHGGAGLDAQARAELDNHGGAGQHTLHLKTMCLSSNYVELPSKEEHRFLLSHGLGARRWKVSMYCDSAAFQRAVLSIYPQLETVQGFTLWFINKKKQFLQLPSSANTPERINAYLGPRISDCFFIVPVSTISLRKINQEQSGGFLSYGCRTQEDRIIRNGHRKQKRVGGVCLLCRQTRSLGSGPPDHINQIYKVLGLQAHWTTETASLQVCFQCYQATREIIHLEDRLLKTKEGLMGMFFSTFTSQYQSLAKNQVSQHGSTEDQVPYEGMEEDRVHIERKKEDQVPHEMLAEDLLQQQETYKKPVSNQRISDDPASARGLPQSYPLDYSTSPSINQSYPSQLSTVEQEEEVEGGFSLLATSRNLDSFAALFKGTAGAGGGTDPFGQQPETGVVQHQQPEANHPFFSSIPERFPTQSDECRGYFQSVNTGFDLSSNQRRRNKKRRFTPISVWPWNPNRDSEEIECGISSTEEVNCGRISTEETDQGISSTEEADLGRISTEETDRGRISCETNHCTSSNETESSKFRRTQLYPAQCCRSTHSNLGSDDSPDSSSCSSSVHWRQRSGTCEEREREKRKCMSEESGFMSSESGFGSG